jgi:hypothetical protein
MGDRRGSYRVLVRRPEGKRSLGRLTLTWEDNIKVNLALMVRSITTCGGYNAVAVTTALFTRVGDPRLTTCVFLMRPF